VAAPLAPGRRAVAVVAVLGIGFTSAGLPGFSSAGLQARPAFQLPERAPGVRTRLLFDEAHHNLYASAASGYRSFVRLVTDEGFSVATNRTAFDSARLAATDILLITNPNGADAAAPPEQRASAAFTGAEVAAVYQWIAAGGALLLVIDHYPTGAAAQSLAERLGVDLSAAWTDDVEHRRTMPTYGPVFGYLVFGRSAGLIGDHPIMNGRDRSERIETVATTTGGSIAGPPGSVALLPLSPTALDWVPSATARDQAPRDKPGDFNPCAECDTRSAAGRSQGIAFELDRGRVVVIGEMGVLIDYTGTTSNRQFALNIVRWLAREL
jgi:hypothetical protein